MSRSRPAERNMFNKPQGAALSDEEVQEILRKVRAVTGIQDPVFARLYALLKRYFDLQLVGAENMPERPTMFVGNHCLLGLDGWLVAPALYFEAGRFVRGMADNIWMQWEGVADRLIANGLIPANPQVCDAVMEDGEDVLVFPGGAFETIKPAAEKYTLKWRERFGFVRMAARHGYSITPFATVGPDDFYDHLIEGSELRDSLPGMLLRAAGLITEQTRDDLLSPLPAGLFGTLLPKPQRTYLAIGEPIAVPHYRGRAVPKKVLTSVREQTAARIESLIADMLLLRAQERHRQGWLRRLLTR